ncbi:MAG: hypothetical protein WCS37_11365 [Chloroflexota bacterium]|nr:hypothetical protein [Chloroflexota bacterium]
MRKRNLTFWFLIGFICYGGVAILISLFFSSGGALAFGGLFLMGAFFCLLKLLFDKYYL